jgi:hypothetical protein
MFFGLTEVFKRNRHDKGKDKEELDGGEKRKCCKLVKETLIDLKKQKRIPFAMAGNFVTLIASTVYN